MQFGTVGFASLDLPTLHRVADYFGVEMADDIQEQVANFATDNITYGDYCREFKVPLPEDYVDEDVPVVVEDEEEGEPVTQTPVTAERNAALQPQKEYLIKMTRENPYFEVGRYKFTQEHPYAIMDATTAQHVLSNEEGFRQAFPDELKEFYK
jgi:hypothetical protein